MRLSAAITKTPRQAALQLYAGVAGMLLLTLTPPPPENPPESIADLETDPFVRNALNSATYELYHICRMFLAPLTAALTKEILPVWTRMSAHN